MTKSLSKIMAVALIAGMALIIADLFGLIGNGSGAGDARNKAREEVETTLLELFRSVNERNWPRVEEILDDEVRMDYSSFSRTPAKTISNADIVRAWSRYLPQYDIVEHSIGEINVNANARAAEAQCRGIAHPSQQNAMGQMDHQVIGSFDSSLEKKNDNWRITEMTFHLQFDRGTPGL